MCSSDLGTDRVALEDHDATILPMIVCVLDDLLFSVKISTAAKALGTEVFFERTPGNVVNRVREKHPSLVIFDLNSSKLKPIEAIAELARTPDTAGIPTLGFVSHVDSETIAAARGAGIGEVLARSAFVEQLGSLLRQHG